MAANRALSERQAADLIRWYREKTKTVAEMAEHFGISRPTVYVYLHEAAAVRTASY